MTGFPCVSCFLSILHSAWITLGIRTSGHKAFLRPSPASPGKTVKRRECFCADESEFV